MSFAREPGYRIEDGLQAKVIIQDNPKIVQIYSIVTTITVLLVDNRITDAQVEPLHAANIKIVFQGDVPLRLAGAGRGA